MLMQAYRSFAFWWPFSRRSRFRIWSSRLGTKIKFFLWLLLIAAAVGGLAGGILIQGGKVGNLGAVIATGSKNQSGILLVGHIYDVDVSLRQVRISWLIDGCGSYQMHYTMSYGIPTCGRLNRLADFYIDGSTQASGSFDPWSTPYHTDGGYVYVQAVNEFPTTHVLEVIDWRGVDQLYAYPFDTYYLDTSIIALDGNNRNAPLLNIIPVDSTDGFTPYILESYFIARPSPVNRHTLVNARHVRIALRRTILTQFFVVSLFLTNWALTGVVVYITLCANDGVDMKNSILVLPISVVVTIPTLRSLWIGAPGFGIFLDTCGLFVQMSIIALCSLFLVVRIGLSSKVKQELRRRRHRRRRTSQDSRAEIQEFAVLYSFPYSHGQTESQETLKND